MKNEVRPIDANALAKRIREYMDDFPYAKTRLATCRVVLSMLGDEGQTPTLTDHFPELTKMVGKEKGGNMDKPRICEVLGLEVSERVAYKDPNGETLKFFIKPDGDIVFVFENGKPFGQIGMGYAIAQVINHPERIIREPRFTEQEVEDAKAVRRLFGQDVLVYKAKDGCDLKILTARESMITYIDSSLFPSIQLGQTVTLDEIIGGAE